MGINPPNPKFWNGITAGSVVVNDTIGGTIIIPERNGGQGYSYIYIRNIGSEDAWITVGDVLVPLVNIGIQIKATEWWEGDDRGMPTGAIKGITAGALSTTFSFLLGD